MMYYFICDFCDCRWSESAYDPSRKKCISCGDKKVRYNEKSRVIVDTYEGSPAFPEKEDDEPFDQYDGN